jgi:hypothetical protein
MFWIIVLLHDPAHRRVDRSPPLSCASAHRLMARYSPVEFSDTDQNSWFLLLRQVIQFLRQQSITKPSHYQHHAWPLLWVFYCGMQCFVFVRHNGTLIHKDSSLPKCTWTSIKTLGRMFYGQMIQKYNFYNEMCTITPGENQTLHSTIENLKYDGGKWDSLGMLCCLRTWVTCLNRTNHEFCSVSENCIRPWAEAETQPGHAARHDPKHTIKSTWKWLKSNTF